MSSKSSRRTVSSDNRKLVLRRMEMILMIVVVIETGFGGLGLHPNPQTLNRSNGDFAVSCVGCALRD